MNKIICIYHGNCTDGTTAAAVLLKKYHNCKTFPLEHGYNEENINQLLKIIDSETVVFIVDFSLRDRDLKNLLSKAKEVINIDHHISAKEFLEKIEQKFKNFKFIFDVNSSGASLTWKYIFKTDPPELIKLVEDQDIWKWEYGDKTKYANLYLLPYTNKPEEVLKLLEKPIEDIIEKGKIIASFSDYLINRYVEKAKYVNLKIGKHTVKGFNTNYFQSEIGNILATKLNQTVILFNIQGYDVKLSFRSNSGHKPDALDLAKFLGGGGHRNAAGALISLNHFFQIIEFKTLEDNNGN